MSWIIFAFIAVFGTVIFTLLSKKILTDEDDHDPIAFAAITFLLVSFMCFVTYITIGVQQSDIARLLRPYPLTVLFFIDILIYTIAPSLYYRALKEIPASESSILYALTGVYIMIIGIAIKTELFIWSRFVGALFVIFAICLIVFKKNKFKINKYFWMMIGGTVLYAIAAVMDNYIVTTEYFSSIFFQMLQFGLPAIFILFVNPHSIKSLKKIYTNKKTLQIILVNAFFFFISYFSIFQAYKSGGTTSQVNIFVSTETVLTVIFAAIFLKERDNLYLKICAGILATIGIYLLA